MKIGLKIKHFRNEKKMKQSELAEKLGVSTQMIVNYENETRAISIEKLETVAKILNVPIVDFFIDESNKRTMNHLTKIPILSNVSAGIGMYGQETPIDFLELPTSFCKGADYASFVSGDSMEPKIFQGDLLLIKEKNTLGIGDIGIFKINDEIFCKKYKENIFTKEITLHSLNPKYESILINKDFCHENDFYILGKVVGKFDYDF